MQYKVLPVVQEGALERERQSQRLQMRVGKGGIFEKEAVLLADA
jgi:hypothetical protein